MGSRGGQAGGWAPILGSGVPLTSPLPGTSTDVSRYAGEFEHVFEASTAGVTLQAPQLDINTVAAGGGSRLFFRSAKFPPLFFLDRHPRHPISPDIPHSFLFSQGQAFSWWGLSPLVHTLALPATAKVRKGCFPPMPCPLALALTLTWLFLGGPATVTDANLVLGRLLPSSFPCIFGPGEDQPLSPEASRKALEAVAAEVNNFLTQGPGVATPLSLEEVAMGFVRVANEAMCRPIRALTQVRPPPGPSWRCTSCSLPTWGPTGGRAFAECLWLYRPGVMTPQPTCWPALGELVGSTPAPSPVPWAWTLYTFIGEYPRSLPAWRDWARVWLQSGPSPSPVLQAQWAALCPGTGPGRRGARGPGALCPGLRA